MLAQIFPRTDDFYAIARYLVEGDKQPPSPDRVAWVLGHNLPTDDPDLAAKIMTATAARSQRCKKAAYHMVISWHERERPADEIMQEIAAKTLAMAGLGEHQAFIMGHGDKPQKHLHMLINRVHPETGKAWKVSHEYALFDRIMRELSDEYGFEYVPCHVFNPELTDDKPKKPAKRATWAAKRATWAAKRGAKTDRPQWSKNASRAFGERMGHRLDRASTWSDLEAALEEEGLKLEAKGRGLIVGNAASYTKLSALGLSSSAMDFEKRFGTSFTEHRTTRPTEFRPSRSIFHVDGVDIARALAGIGLATQDSVRAAIDDATAVRNERLAKAPLMTQLMRQIATTLAAATSLTHPTHRASRPKAKPRRKATPTPAKSLHR
ncbi:MAG: relaxase/mobilization nuclease domain-containing protein [Candidatus Competibacter sp.]|nr:relaxase/mobilization nuclease domain-containing protein [Candidatus Competibacter sp.]